MTLQETHILRRLDERLGAGKRGVIETQYGEISVHITKIGYCAEYFDYNNTKYIAFDDVPSVAFLKMANQVRAMMNN